MRFWKVIKKFKGEMRPMRMPGLGVIEQSVDANPGDEIHDRAGAGSVYVVTKQGGTFRLAPRFVLPLDCLEELTPEKARKVKRYE